MPSTNRQDDEFARLFGDTFAAADRLAGQRAVSELLRNDASLSPETRAALELSQQMQSTDAPLHVLAPPSPALVRWRIARARLLYLSPLRHVFALFRRARSVTAPARHFTLPRLPDGSLSVLFGLVMLAGLYTFAEGLHGLAAFAAIGLVVILASVLVVMPLAKITTSLLDEGESSPFLALWIFLFPTIGVGVLLKLFGMETGFCVVFGILGGLFDLNYYYNIHLHKKPEEPAPTGPQRGSGPYGRAGYAYASEFIEPELHMHPQTPEEWARSVYLQKFVEVYGQPIPVPAFHLGYHGDIHGITIAPSGSGKGVAGIAPTILLNQQNVAVLDLKGENWFVTHKSREELGHTVHVLNPWNLWGKELGYIKPMSARFNPLHSLRTDDPKFTQYIRGLAAALIIEQGKEPHFTNRARDLVACLMAHVCSDAKELKAGNNHLPRVRQILGLPIEAFADYMLDAALNPVPLVRNNAATFSAPKPGEARELQGIISTALGQLGFLDDPAIVHFLTGSTFDFAQLRQPLNSVFIMMPPEQLRDNKHFARLLVQSLFNGLWRQPNPGDASVLLILDEQSKLGYMEDLKNAPGLLRGYGVRMWSIFQDLGQLKDVFAEAWEGTLANAGFVQLFTPGELTTAEYFSRKIGKTTAQVMNISGGTTTGTSEQFGPNANGGGSTSSGSSSGWSQSPAQVDAVTPQDLMGMPKDRGLVFAHGLQFPAMTTRTPYYQEPEFARWSYLPNPQRQEDYARAIELGRAWHAERTAAQARRVSIH